jgi:hypothetical protein
VDELEDLPSGIYRHYKGHLYLVLGYATDSNIVGRRGVVYVGLELSGAREGARMHFRTVDNFFSDVIVDGRVLPRFTYLGPEWHGSE